MKKSPIKKISKKRAARLKWYSEKDLFWDIRESRPHVCEVCDKYIPEALTRCFAHMLSKMNYPEHRTDKNNIALVCSIDCHWKADKICSWKKRIIEYSLANQTKITIKELISL